MMRAMLTAIMAGAAALSGWTVALCEAGQNTGRPGQRTVAREGGAPPLLTVAEASEWRKTARYDEVNEFIAELARRSDLVHVSDIGKSVEGREIPLVIIADPPVKSAEEARKSGKPTILLLGGVHSGECDGKEALLMLTRELVLDGEKGEGEARAHELLKEIIVAIVPIYNPDGNERMSPDNRRGQVGPDEMGIRENAQGLDLNRDFVKLEASETRGLVHFINEWDPAVIVDTHTTNGSLHRYPLTYDGPRNPAGDGRVIEFVRDTMLPALTTRVKERAGLDTFWYGNFRGEWEGEQGRADRHTRWETYPDLPRYGVPYVGLRNRIGILTESYSYATYQERIEAQVAFVREVLSYAAENRAAIQKLIADADGRTTAAGRRAGAADEVPIRTKMVAAPEKATVLGYEEERRDGRVVSTGVEREYEVDLYTRFEAELTVTRPFAYIISAPPLRIEDLQSTVVLPGHPEWITTVVHTLQRHGIKVEELREDLELEATVYGIEGVTKAMRPFQGHDLVTVRATPRQESTRIAAGSYLIRTAQPLGSLAVYLLEPESADGLATWNFFDPALEVGGVFPVVRLETAAAVTAIEARPLPEDREPLRPITFEDVYEGGRGPNFGGSPVGGIRWIDSEHFLQVKEGRLRTVHAATGRSEPFHDPAKMAAALAKLPTIDRRTADSLARRTSFTMDSKRTAALFEHKGDLYYATFDGSKAARLTSDPRRAELASFSPDGKFVAFVRENDLWVVDVEMQRERQLTTGGHDLLRHGKADWVYHEEVYGRSWRVYWWSPDSQRIAYMRVDSSPVRTFTIVSDIPDPPNGQTVETVPYPKPGTPNPRATLWTVEAAGGEPREVSLDAYSEEDRLIVGVGWWPDSSALYAYVSNRTQTWADVLRAGPAGGKPTRLFRETTGAWVAKSPAPLFQRDGSFVFSSERDGYMHLYHYSKDGKLIRRITEGDWEVRGIARTSEGAEGLGDDEATGESGEWIHFTAMKDNPIAANLYRVRLDGTGLRRLTMQVGSHSASVSPGGKYFVDSWSAHAHPTRVVLYAAREEYAEGAEGGAELAEEAGIGRRNPGSGARSQEGRREQIGDQRARPVAPSVRVGRGTDDSTTAGSSASSSDASPDSSTLRSLPTSANSAYSLLRILDTNPVRDLERFIRVPVKMVQIPTPDGFILEGALILPPDFDESLKYPLWFTTYAGPKAPSISDSWRMVSTWDQVLAQKGYVVFRTDPRSASGKGAKSAWAAYRQLGVPELEDIEHAIRWLKEHPWVDASRIGISGHSYGGFMAAYAMTNSTLFAAGIAGAPVTDWRLYDSIYTERYMLTPQENPEGYEKTSAVESAKNLHGRLLLLHGMMDDNVHLQNATRMVRALHHAGKQNFELMLYPEARHGLGGGPAGRHYQRLMMEFIDRTVGPGTAAAREGKDGSPGEAGDELQESGETEGSASSEAISGSPRRTR
jgi:dipeptidyl-peptidase 4